MAKTALLDTSNCPEVMEALENTARELGCSKNDAMIHIIRQYHALTEKLARLRDNDEPSKPLSKKWWQD